MVVPKAGKLNAGKSRERATTWLPSLSVLPAGKNCPFFNFGEDFILGYARSSLISQKITAHFVPLGGTTFHPTSGSSDDLF